MAHENRAITSPVNQYLGINAHLHSHFLHGEPEGWEEFHSSHITDLTRAMNALLPAMGYIARQERSLQIRHFDDTVSSPISDVLLNELPYRNKMSTAQPFTAPQVDVALNVPAATLPTPEAVETKRPFAIKIYELHEGGQTQRERPVVWIELLSPSNKVGQGYLDYVAKRDTLLANWLVFVELDYLHGISTTLTTIPDYRPLKRDQRPVEDAHPYHLWLIDPRIPPDAPDSAAIAVFDVDQPIPKLTIPLKRDEQFTFDFNQVYHQTFRAQPAFGMAVNYATAPDAAARDYNTRDQTVIAARMLTVQQLDRDGVNLYEGPYAILPAIEQTVKRRPELVMKILTAPSPQSPTQLGLDTL